MNFTVLSYALLAGIVPSLIWLWFWLKEDNLNPEPRNIIAMTFVGGCISVIFAIIFEKIVQDFISDTNIQYAAWAAIEEILKWAAVMFIAYRSRILDEPIDVMIYCITAALGFAALENTFFILNPFHLGEFSTGIISGNLRFVGATLVHVVCSASIGFMMGLTFYKGAFVKIISTLLGIILAIALHTSFNLAIINGTAINTLKVFGWVWCAVVILIILFEEIKVIRPKHK